VKLPYRSCCSPNRYKHLEAVRYTFLVRAPNAGRSDPTAATKRFTISYRPRTAASPPSNGYALARSHQNARDSGIDAESDESSPRDLSRSES
jgi:hypothetical protein